MTPFAHSRVPTVEPSRSAADPTRPSSDEGNDAKGILRVEVPADAPLY